MLYLSAYVLYLSVTKPVRANFENKIKIQLEAREYIPSNMKLHEIHTELH